MESLGDQKPKGRKLEGVGAKKVSDRWLDGAYTISRGFEPRQSL
jgi:hypothetical protein